MNEKTIDQIEEEVLIYQISDEAVEAAGTRTEIAGVWTFVCTGVQSGQVYSRSDEKPRPRKENPRQSTHAQGSGEFAALGF
jgi:hypothetical protein